MDLADCLYHRLFARPSLADRGRGSGENGAEEIPFQPDQISGTHGGRKQSMRNGAYAMLDALRSNPSPDATPPKSQAQIESEFITQAETQAEETLKRVNIKLIKLGEPGKADLVAACSQTVYWPISFEAEDPGPAATKLVLTIFAYRNPLGKWDANVKTLQTQAGGIRQEIPESMLKQLGL
jgi:hypothetical protein